MSKPMISFVIPTHSRCQRMLKTLSLLARNVGRLPHEVIVADNASTDGTADTLAEQLPRVRRIELDTDLDTASRNLALAAAEGEFVFMLDDDSWPQAGTTERALQVMGEQPRLAAAGCYTRQPGDAIRHQPGGLPGVFVGSAVVLRRKAILEIGGYPINYGGCLEEHDLSARLWQADWQVKWLDSLLAWQHPRTDVDSSGVKALTASSLRFWSRYAPQDRHDTMIEQIIERYRKIARKNDALPSYQEGLAIGLNAVSHNSTRRRPLSEKQFDHLLGLDHLRRRLQQLRSSGITRLLLWRPGQAAEQILEVAGSLGLKITSQVTSASDVADTAFPQLEPYLPHEADRADAQAVLAGSLSPGVSLDLLAEARSHVSHLPLVDPVARSVRDAIPNAA